MDLNAYLDAARTAQGHPSDNQLALFLGISRQRLSSLRHGHWMPSDDTMAAIAAAGKQDVGLALLRLNYWRTRNGRARETYKAMLAKAGYAATFALFVGASSIAPSPARAGLVERGASADCILWNRRKRARGTLAAA